MISPCGWEPVGNAIVFTTARVLGLMRDIDALSLLTTHTRPSAPTATLTGLLPTVTSPSLVRGAALITVTVPLSGFTFQTWSLVPTCSYVIVLSCAGCDEGSGRRLACLHQNDCSLFESRTVAVTTYRPGCANECVRPGEDVNASSGV